MGRKSLAAVRRQQIIKAFYKVIAEKGFIGATTREITRAAGVSKGVLHHYFASKDEMVLGVVDYVLDSFLSDFRRATASGPSATDRLKSFITFFSDSERFNLVHDHVWIELINYAKSNRRCEEFARRAYGGVMTVALDIIRQGIEAGEFRRVDPNVIVEILWMNLEGAALLSCVHAIKASRETLRDQGTAMFLNYLTSDKGGIERQSR